MLLRQLLKNLFRPKYRIMVRVAIGIEIRSRFRLRVRVKISVRYILGSGVGVRNLVLVHEGI